MKHPWYLFFSDNELTFSGPDEIRLKEEAHTSKNKAMLMKEMKISAQDETTTLNRMVMVYFATNLNEDQFKKLRVAFIEIDENKNGTICINEL